MSDLTYTVPPTRDGDTLQNFLRRDCGLSWRMVVKLKRVDGGMAIDGVSARTIDRVRAGQTVTLRLPEDTVRIEPADLPLQVVWEDDHLLVVNKPPYLAVHPSAGLPDPTLANAVVGYYERKGETRSFRPVNRLDRNTSGLLMAAKNAHATFAMAGRVQKDYLALVLGALTGAGTIDQPLRVREGSCITREVGEGGKPSVTHWRALATNGAVTLVWLRLETGRTHQIRAHMAWLGYPLAGDTMYGTDETVLPRHGLHCYRMTFVHPLTGERVDLRVAPPDDMAAVIAAIPGAAEAVEELMKRQKNELGSPSGDR
ncbi:MAG: RluA family pseudouridine synthase [Acutalibacteraceae bacterium]|jgi:23S rRNA pseudouridine1911/1915/1917 synthase